VPGHWLILGAGDFAGGGKTCSDILWRDNISGAVAIWFMDGLQVASTTGVATVGSDWMMQALSAD
jgi:hypothetical protein